jgi:hypothetical protein
MSTTQNWRRRSLKFIKLIYRIPSNEVQISECYPEWITTKYCLRNIWKIPFMALRKLDFIMDHYGWKSELPHDLGEASRIEFQQNLWNGLQKMQDSPFVVLCELGFLVDQYGWKSELMNNIWWKSPISDRGYNKIWQAVYGTHENVHSWLYVSWFHYESICPIIRKPYNFWKSFTENLNSIYETVYGTITELYYGPIRLKIGTVWQLLMQVTPNRISTISAKQFLGYMEWGIYGPM